MKTNTGEMMSLPTATKKVGWQQSGTLTTSNSVKTVSMQANFAEPGYYTAQFGVITPSPTIAGDITTRFFVAEADVEWSVEGSTVRRVVSVGNGVTISGPGQGVRISIRDKTPVVLGIVHDYVVTMQVTQGCRPQTQAPPYLTAFYGHQTLAPSTAQTIDVPQNSGVTSLNLLWYMVSASPEPSALVQLTAVDAIGTLLSDWSPAVVQGFVPIPPGTAQVFVSNNDPANALLFQVLWGIDG